MSGVITSNSAFFCSGVDFFLLVEDEFFEDVNVGDIEAEVFFIAVYL